MPHINNSANKNTISKHSDYLPLVQSNNRQDVGNNHDVIRVNKCLRIIIQLIYLLIPSSLTR